MSPEGFYTIILRLMWMAVVVMVEAEDQDEFPIGATCPRNGRCRIQLAECVDNVCRCRLTMVPNNKRNGCLEKSKLNDHCQEDIQCQTEHSTCKKARRVCDCRRNYVQSKDGEHCLPFANLGDSCTEMAQCQNLTECRESDNRCVCHGIAYEFKGRCVTDHSGSIVPPTSSSSPIVQEHGVHGL